MLINQKSEEVRRRFHFNEFPELVEGVYQIPVRATIIKGNSKWVIKGLCECPADAMLDEYSVEWEKDSVMQFVCREQNFRRIPIKDSTQIVELINHPSLLQIPTTVMSEIERNIAKEQHRIKQDAARAWG